MFKVIIADDEPKVARLIQDLIGWEAEGMRVCGIAKNGEEALALIEEHDPDIVITDIRMPVVGGIELIAKAKEIKPSLEFIIISGYKYFDYAHSAIRYGVGDYLLKPISQEELLATLRKIKDRIASRATALFEHEQMLRFQANQEAMRRLTLFELLMEPGDRSQLTVRKVNKDYSYHFKEGLFQFGVFKIDGSAEEIYSESLAVFSEKIRDSFHAALAPLTSDLEVAFIYSGANFILAYSPERKQEVRSALKNIFDDLRVHNHYFPSASFTMVVGDAVESLAGLVESWISAESMLYERLLLGTGAFYENMPQRGSWEGCAPLVRAVGKALEKAMDVMDPAIADAAIQEAGAKILAVEGITGRDILHFAKSVYDDWSMLEQRYDATFPGGEKTRDAFIRNVDILASATEVLRYLRGTVANAFTEIQKQHGEQLARPITHAKRYIQEHFGESISIADIAESEGFNASYFSTLFKKETGQTFSEYLTDVRMNEAKRLLRETKESVSNICKFVGYADMKHFSSLFKGATGVKPSEYRKLYSWG
ncbi:MAG: response regulator [Clostridiales Family XIII bacterium]|jgi:two-component system response regulator YesN|nr:response regulator [Clostridiales Family XIII bacterium]